MESVAPSPAQPPKHPSPAAAAAYEAEHVQSVYDTIAPHFAATRYAPWPRVDAFLAALPAHSLVADLGCGNGKYVRALSHRSTPAFAVGTDLCAALALLATRDGMGAADGVGKPDSTGPDVNALLLQRGDAGVADVRRLPFRDGAFDAALNIAVVHHLSTAGRRIDAWRETLRVVRCGGRALLYVWALERPTTPQPRRGQRGARMLSRRFDSQDVFVPWHMRRRKAGANSDRILGATEQVLRRFYHVYREGELEEELCQVPTARVVHSYYDHQNWCAVVERVSS